MLFTRLPSSLLLPYPASQPKNQHEKKRYHSSYNRNSSQVTSQHFMSIAGYVCMRI